MFRGTKRGVVASMIAIALVAGLAPDGRAAGRDEPVDVTPGVCDAYAGDPEVGTPEWQARDANNVACGYQRYTDAGSSPAFKAKLAEQQALELAEFATVTGPELAAEPNRRYTNCCVNPMSKVGDPFRSPEEWAAKGRGRHSKFWFISRDGAKLRARLFAPASPGRYPVLTFTPGLQSYNEVNAWFAEGMAEAGYVVFIFDPTNQGDSESCGHAPDGTETECPTTNQPDDTRSAIDFVLSTPAAPYPHAVGPNAAGTPTFNPLWAEVDAKRVGIAGHSLGAIAVTPIGQEDPRVDAVVSYDSLDAELPDRLLPSIHAPSLYFGVDYDFPATATPKSSNPDPRAHQGAFDQLRAAGIDTMSVTTRASDHYEFGFQPHPADFPASRYGERLAFYYSLAWFEPDTSSTTALRSSVCGRCGSTTPRTATRSAPACSIPRWRRPTRPIRSPGTRRIASQGSAPPTCCPSTTRRSTSSTASTSATCAAVAARSRRVSGTLSSL